MTHPENPNPVREFIRAFNERDLDGFVAVLDPGVEIHSNRGTRRGLEAARAWATRAPGGAQQTIVLETVHEYGSEAGAERAVALILRRWHWEDGEPAGEEAMAWAFELHGDRVLSWRPYESRDEAMLALGGPASPPAVPTDARSRHPD